jgi:hypothetical protein
VKRNPLKSYVRFGAKPPGSTKFVVKADVAICHCHKLLLQNRSIYPISGLGILHSVRSSPSSGRHSIAARHGWLLSLRCMLVCACPAMRNARSRELGMALIRKKEEVRLPSEIRRQSNRAFYRIRPPVGRGAGRRQQPYIINCRNAPLKSTAFSSTISAQ